MLTSQGLDHAFLSVLQSVGFSERYYGYWEQHHEAEDVSFHPGLEVTEALQQHSKLPFKRNRKEQFVGARYQRGPFSVVLNLIPRPGFLEVVSRYKLAGNSRDRMQIGGGWHRVAMHAMCLEDPYFLYNPPFPRLPVTGEVTTLVRFVLELHADVEKAVTGDERLLQPERYVDPESPESPTHEIVTEERIREAVEAIAGRSMPSFVELHQLTEPWRVSPLVSTEAMADHLKQREPRITRHDRPSRIDFKLSQPVGNLPCEFTIVRYPDILDFSFTISAYLAGGLGGTMGYWASTLAHSGELAASVPRSWLWAANEIQFAELFERGLELFQEFRQAVAKTPIPALSRPGRLNGRWESS